MSRISKHTWLAFVLATLAGACLHFLFELLPNPVTAVLSPVNESLWEHLKLLYWPYLAACLVLSCKEGRALLGQRCLALLLAAVLMQAVGYVYHILLEGSSLGFDIGLFVVLMALAFFLPYFLHSPAWEAHREALLMVTAALGLFLVIFTFLPPRMLLFADLSGVRTWVTLPC